MARHRGVIVGKIKHSDLGITVDMRLDKAEREFYAVLSNGDTIAHETAAGLETAVRKRLEEMHSLAWQPVIAVKELGDRYFTSSDSNAMIGFRSERLWVARKHNGDWMKAGDGWVDSADQININHIQSWHVERDATVPGRGREYTYLNYTEAVWNGLMKLEAAIKELRAHLRNLINTAEGNEQLARVGRNHINLLGDGR